LIFFTEINFCNLSAAERYKSFLVQQFFKNAAEVEGELPSSLPAGSETPLRHGLRRTAKRVRKATAFRGRANKTALPCKRTK
jgi:Mg-chelatase subunit ChlD